MGMTKLNIIQMILWGFFVVSALLVGLPDLMMRSFFPVFDRATFNLVFVSLFLVMCVVGSCPILYKWFD